MALKDTFQAVLDSLPDDWSDLELDLRIHDEHRYIDAAGYLTVRQARAYPPPDRPAPPRRRAAGGGVARARGRPSRARVAWGGGGVGWCGGGVQVGSVLGFVV